MRRLYRAILCVSVILLDSLCSPGSVLAESGVIYSLLFTWRTEGSHELLAKKATAIGRLDPEKTLAVSLGNLLGPTRIVQNDRGVQFLRAARSTGLDYVVPGTGEFIFGVHTLKILTEFSGVPEFVSANIVDERTGRTIVEPYVIREISGLRICLVGMSERNIIRDSKDENVVGMDVLPFEDAFESISGDISRERPDIVVVAGRLDRDSIVSMAKKFPLIDVFMTCGSSGGFADTEAATTSILISDKPVYFVSEQGNHVDFLTVKYIDGMETREFADIVLGDEYPRNEEIAADLNATLEELKKKDEEEAVVIRTGREVASILKDVFDVDVVFFERDCLYYYPLEDSLTLFDVEKVVKPSRGLVAFTLKGAYLRSVWEQSLNQAKPGMRLHWAGITGEGKVNDIPIQDDMDYTVVSTPALRAGAFGYTQFLRGTTEREFDVDMLTVVSDYLVAKDERLREAAKKKIWSLELNLAFGSNFTKTDVDRDQSLYGKVPPKEFRKLEDLFTGFFEVSSWDDKFVVKHRKHIYESRLRARYLRSGIRTEEGEITYRESRDELQLLNKYTYDLPGFKLKPFMAVDIYSEFYSPGGKHPVVVSTRAGLSREIKTLWNMVVEIGLDGTRNYVNNENTFGTTNKFTLTKSFPAKGLFTTPVKISIDAQATWNPMAKYHMAFFMRNNNRINFQIWKRFNATFHIKSYAYRDTRHRRVAIGFIYDFTLNYKMDWKL